MSYTTVKSFNSIQIKPRTLVLCDIDETLLKFEQINNKWWKSRIDHHYESTKDPDLADSKAYAEWLEIVTENKPSHTDEDGFKNMIERIEDGNGNIIFVTARHTTLKNITNTHLEHVGISDRLVLFCDGEPKGPIIKKEVDTHNYDHVVFIDDGHRNIQSVNEVFGDAITCFKYEIE